MTMLPLKAHVKNGRLVLDEPTDLPEGDVVDLQRADSEVSAEEQASLHRALECSMAQANAGHLVDAGEVIGRLLARP